MKRIAILLALLLIASSMISLSSLADANIYTVTFFTEDEHLGLVFRNPGLGFSKSLSVLVYEGTVITRLEDDALVVQSPGWDYLCLPDIKTFLGGEFSEYKGEWVVDPEGIEVTGPMRFEAYIPDKPENICNVRFFVTDRPGDLGGWGVRYFEDITIGFEEGYVLKEQDVPVQLPPQGGFPRHTTEWETEPVGTIVTDYHEFRGLTIPLTEFELYFHGPRHELIKAFLNVPRGSSVEPPEAPECPGKVFLGWDPSDAYIDVQASWHIGAMYVPLGDANLDDIVNTGDSAMILRYTVGIGEKEQKFEEIADYNLNGQVDSGDASGVLRFTVGL